MDDAVVKDLIQALAEFDAISEQCTAARTAHVGASARLRALGQEVVDLVRVIDGLNRIASRTTTRCSRSGSVSAPCEPRRATWRLMIRRTGGRAASGPPQAMAGGMTGRRSPWGSDT